MNSLASDTEDRREPYHAVIHGKSNFSTRPTRISGFWGSTVAAYEISKLARKQKRTFSIVVVVPDSRAAEEIERDLHFFLDEAQAKDQTSTPAITISKFLNWEVLPFDELSPARDISAERLFSLKTLAMNQCSIVVATAPALMQRILLPRDLMTSIRKISLNMELSRDKFIASLDSLSYVRTTLVEEVGQMAVRGAVVDFFPPGINLPIRVELFADIIGSIRTFNPATQRSVTSLAEFEIMPVGECVHLADSSQRVQFAIDKIKERADDLAIPTNQIEGLIDALKGNADYPGLEHLFCLISESSGTFLDYVSESSLLVAYDEIAIAQALDSFEALVEERSLLAEKEGRLFCQTSSAFQTAEHTLRQLRKRGNFFFDTVDMLSFDDSLRDAANESHAESPSLEKVRVYSNSEITKKLWSSTDQVQPFKELSREIKARIDEGVAVALVTSQASRVQRIVELLTNYEISCERFKGSFANWRSRVESSSGRDRKVVSILEGVCGSGLRALDDALMFILDTEIFRDMAVRQTRFAAQNIKRFLGTKSQLSENDFVVHVDHGIAIYRGLKAMTVEGEINDYLHLEYAEGAKLYVPMDNIAKVQKYISAGGGAEPQLTKLGSTAWEKAKTKVRQNVQVLAGELIKIYAERQVAKGLSFGEPDEEDERFADSFAFTETPDQMSAIDDVLRDMASDKPMDRLVCGDVGYGKTEVAVRAAFKAVMSGKQVAILVPTTVLADQHFATFSERFAGYPIRLKCLSRFCSPIANRQTVLELASGSLDVVIGTHRLLQRDVHFKDLGLLIIDEEHRFGVAHKERFKRFKREIDVLTLSATPIPRTLNMSLSGIRDLSVIETPPSDRQVIRTYIAPYSDGVVREAIMREIGRSGQVFYIHNRVSNIAAIAAELGKLVPEAKIEFAHGQMHEKELEVIMHRFVSREIDVLVSTTIVESGLDIPNANTIIIRGAEKFGLAELYQLRGRVGRSSRRAYAYLLVQDLKNIAGDAKRRLQVLQSLDDLGVGFRLALQDMEIRGAGNLLGKDQSGQVSQVGFELYSRILKEVVDNMQESAVETTNLTKDVPIVEPEVHIGFPVHIPEWYIPDVAERLVLYQRLVDLRDEARAGELREEIEDRFGRLPEEVALLLELMTFRSLLKQARIVSASFRNSQLVLAFHPRVSLDGKTVIEAIQTARGRLKISPDMVLKADIGVQKLESPAELLGHTKAILKQLGVQV
ncbi:MAG: transcription-repair coupling factor [Deltaproteobacteria bacterium]|nr:transcription-repair coupling factor [Deltaproteobacteria bacterium]